MKTPVPEYLQEVLDECGGSTGEVADYIPELAKADPDKAAVALATLDGPIHAAGDVDTRFTIQSISKPFVYAMALREHGLDRVMESVGVEPTGDPYNEVSLEHHTGRPRNPMINVGAIVTHSLIGGDIGGKERDELVREGLSEFAGRRLDADEATFESESANAHRNLAMAHMVRSLDIVAGDPHSLVRGYIRGCSLSVDVRDLAVMAATLANAGTNPVTGVEVVPDWVARQVLSVMATCGMYDAAGDWFCDVGIPAKSGVSGGILGALPGQVGVGVYSPRLDPFGTSARGVQICERLSQDMGLHLMGTPATGASVLRDSHEDDEEEPTPDPEPHEAPDDDVRTFELQGPIHFAGAEVLLRVMADIEPGDDEIVLDLSRVTGLDDTGRRMIAEGVARLRADGHEVTTLDPEGHFGEDA